MIHRGTEGHITINLGKVNRGDKMFKNLLSVLGWAALVMILGAGAFDLLNIPNDLNFGEYAGGAIVMYFWMLVIQYGIKRTYRHVVWNRKPDA